MDSQHNTVRIAVLEEQLSGLRAQQKAHNESTQRRFDGMEEKIDDLAAIMNRGKGAFAASMALAAAIGAFLLQGIGMIFHSR